MLKYLIITSLLMFGCATKDVILKTIPQGQRESQASLDVRGKTITTYIAYQAEKQLSNMDEESVLELITSNYEAIESDLRAWARQRGYPLLDVEKTADYERYYIEKKQPKKNPKKVAVIITDPGLTTSLTPLGFALAAALQGAELHIYIQGPAVKMLETGFKAKLPGFSRPFSGFARDQLADIGHIPPQEKLKQLHELGAHLYICAPSLDYFKVARNKLIFDDLPVIEYLSFMEIMSQADIQYFTQ